MKTLLLSVLLSSLTGISFGQKLEKYCEMVATAKMFSTKVSIVVNYGEHLGYWKDNREKDSAGHVISFNNVTDALNYLGSKGWRLVNAFPISEGSSGGKVLHFYFKKEYDPNEVMKEE